MRSLSRRKVTPVHVPVLHYVDQRVAAVEREVEFRWDATEAEINRRVLAIQAAMFAAKSELDSRLAEMNNFRAAMSDQAAHHITRDAFDSALTNLSDKLTTMIGAESDRVDKVEATLDRQRGRQAAYAGLAAVMGVVMTILILVVGHVRVT